MGRTSDARRRLMDAAHELIWEHSYGAVTIDAICQRAGVRKGSFYYFFDSKSDLAVAAIDAWWVERKALIDQVFRPEVPPLDRIRRYIDFVAERQIQSFETTGQIRGCPLFILGAEISTQDERIVSRIKDILNTGIRLFQESIEESRQSGEIDCDDVPLRARLLWAFYEGTLTQARIDNNPRLLRTFSADAMALIGVRHAALMAA